MNNDVLCLCYRRLCIRLDGDGQHSGPTTVNVFFSKSFWKGLLVLPTFLQKVGMTEDKQNGLLFSDASRKAASSNSSVQHLPTGNSRNYLQNHTPLRMHARTCMHTHRSTCQHQCGQIRMKYSTPFSTIHCFCLTIAVSWKTNATSQRRRC